jgi:hypothetical protein
VTPDDHERTFAALPPAHGRGFAQTWWGQAWLKALEDTALDSAQLKTGRRLARAGAVGAVSVRPGRITAVVQDRDGTAHRSRRAAAGVVRGAVGPLSGHGRRTGGAHRGSAGPGDAAAPGRGRGGRRVELLPGMGDWSRSATAGLGPLSAHGGSLLSGGPAAGPGSVRAAPDARDAASAPAGRVAGTQRPRAPGERPSRRSGRRAWTPRRRTRPGTSCRRCPTRPNSRTEPGLPPSLDTETPASAGRSGRAGVPGDAGRRRGAPSARRRAQAGTRTALHRGRVDAGAGCRAAGLGCSRGFGGRPARRGVGAGPRGAGAGRPRLGARGCARARRAGTGS